MIKNLVVGAGFSGAVIAHLIADVLNEKVIVIDKKPHIAGNSYDYRDKNGIMIHKYGSHIFHTNNDKVWKFVRRFARFNQYMHKVYALIDGIETTIPFNLNSLYDVFPKTLSKRLEEKLLDNFEYNTKVSILEFQEQNDSDLKFLSSYVYEKVFLHYTKKQWGYNPDEIDSAITKRVPVYISKDNRYFQDKYQGIPLEGYSGLIENMLNHKNIEVCLNTDFKDFNEDYERLFYTGAIDEFFDYEYGKLPYRSLKFEWEEVDVEFYQKNSVVNYPCNYDFTRIHEFKHYLNDKASKTVISKEYPILFESDMGGGGRYYPILKDENIKLYTKYLNKAKTLKNVYFSGRLGDYKYYDMDKAIERSMGLFEEIFKKEINSL